MKIVPILNDFGIACAMPIMPCRRPEGSDSLAYRDIINNNLVYHIIRDQLLFEAYMRAILNFGLPINSIYVIK